MRHARLLPAAIVSVAAMTGLAIGCGGATNAGGASSSAGDRSTEPPSAAARTTSAAGLEVHEWGVVRAEPGDQLVVSTAPPPEAATYFFSPDAVVEKPVLYFHLEGDAPLTVRSVRITTDQQILEHWPLTGAPLGAHALTWEGLTVRRAHCAASHYPSATEAPCDLIVPSSECEAATLARYEAASAACLERADGTRHNMLFYRSRTRVTPPLQVSRTADGLVSIATSIALPDTTVVWARGGLATTVLAPEAHQALALQAPSEPVAHAIEQLSGEMRRRGLTDDEIATFWAAWSTTLAASTPRRVGPVEHAVAEEDLVEERLRPVEQPPLPAPDVVFYFLPGATIDAISRLEIDPAPRRVVRVLGLIQAPPS